MNVPLLATTGEAVKKAFDFKTILISLIITAIVVFVFSKITTNEVILYDEEGNLIADGEVKQKFKKFTN